MTTGSTRLVILDLDNTLYDWVEFYVPSLLDMATAVARALEIRQEDVLDELRDVYREHGSLEYAFAVQRTRSIRELSPHAQAQIVRTAQAAFGAARDRHLKPYPGVKPTLEYLRDLGVRAVAASNAPLFQAQRRLRHLGLLEFFDGIAARVSFRVPTDDPAIGDVLRHEVNGKYACPLEYQREFPENDLKPSTEMYRTILRDLAIDPSAAVAVGDSVAKDIAPALSLGARGAWARYGTRPRAELLEVLLRVTPWSQASVDQQYRYADTPVPTLSEFADVIEVL